MAEPLDLDSWLGTLTGGPPVETAQPPVLRASKPRGPSHRSTIRTTPEDRNSDGRPLKGHRVQIVADLMARGLWDGEQTVKQLADEWRLTESAVYQDAGEAGRMLRRALPDEEYRAICLDDLDQITQNAIDSTDARMVANAIKAIELRLKARGLLVQKIDQTNHDDEMAPREVVQVVVGDPQLRPLLMQALKEEEDG